MRQLFYYKIRRAIFYSKMWQLLQNAWEQFEIIFQYSNVHHMFDYCSAASEHIIRFKIFNNFQIPYYMKFKRCVT